MANQTTALHHGDSAYPAASSFTASSSASVSCSQYDVFINHRGPDVKNTFASHLYRDLINHGLRVFLDRQEMKKGDSISSQIEYAIRGAYVHVAIFSPTYAESRWCLDELVRMKNSKGTILPVFYKVDPSVLRWTVKDGVYAKSLRDHEQKKTQDSETGEEKPRYGSDTIQDWRNALSFVADLSGFVHRDDDDEAELLHNVVESVLNKVPKPPLDVAKYATGLGEKLQDFENTVLTPQQNEKPVEAKVVGIVGVGGVGKTTLAKEFFNVKRSNYNSSSFLFDVGENVRTRSLVYLQKKLLEDLKQKDIKIDSRDEGIGILKRDLSSCHALIVLDDVDGTEQLEAVLPIKKILRPDSLILVTSRHKHVLRKSEVLRSAIYNLKGMNTPHSKALFSCYAFHRPDPLPEFADLVDRFVKACDGLPLSLKVFGAQVCEEDDISVWLEILDDPKLPGEIHDKLKISYESLSPEVMEIFLDIACFFLGEDGDKARRIWGKVGVGNLQDRCLLELDSKNKIKMHDHIRDMGRKIADERSMPGRLWNLFQQSAPVLTEVRGIKMVSSYSDPFMYKDINQYSSSGSSQISPSKRLEMKHLFSNFHFPGMRNLQLVATEDEHLEDVLKRVQPLHLKWFRWHRCSHTCLPDWIPMENLRVLEVEGRNLNVLWPHQSQAVPLQLRELNICAPLSDIPKSVGQLKFLERITVWNSFKEPRLKRLPDEFCHLHSLKYLVFKRFSRIVSLPDSFGELTNLQHIDLEGASRLQMLPNSFGNLTRLKHLSLSRCENLTMSNRTLGNITTLEYLNLSFCKQLKELPPQVAQQRSLHKLHLWGTHLKELPSGIGDLCNLEVLELGSDLLEALPLGLGGLKGLKVLLLSGSPQLKCLNDSIFLLTQLTSLTINNCGIEYLPQELLKLNNLEVLAVDDCPLREHPFKKEVGVNETLSSFEGNRALNDRCMLGLKRINLSGTAVREVFLNEGVCPNLQELYVSRCCELRQIALCGLPKLRRLSLRCSSKAEELPRLETLISLESLHVTGSEKLQSIQWLGQLTKLQSLEVGQFHEIQELPGLEHLTFLKRLVVRQCEKLQRLQGLGQLTKLATLEVGECNEIQHLQGVEQLTSLYLLSISGCKKLQSIGVENSTSLESLSVFRCEKFRSIQGLGQLTKLESLYVYQCHEIQHLQGVEQLTSLDFLSISVCKKLQSIQGLGQLTKLQYLSVDQCPEIQELPGLENLTSLNTLQVTECEKLQSIQWSAQLTELNISGCHGIPDLPSVGYLKFLERLKVTGLWRLKSLQELRQLTKLRELDVSKCHEISALPGVERLTSLERLNVSGLGKLKGIQGLGRLTEIRELDVSGCHEISELPGLEHLTSLEKLNVSGVAKLKSIEGIGQLTDITELDVSECHEIELPGLEHLTSLRKLNVSGLGKLKSIPGLGHPTKIMELDVSGCHEISELPGLEHLTSLWKLNVSGLPKLKSMLGLGQLTCLRELDVSECHEISELPGLEHLTFLEKLNVSGLRKLKSIQGLGQLTEIRELDVHECYEISELPDLGHLTLLEKLDVSGLHSLMSIPELGQLPRIRELNVSECYELLELPGVEYLVSLEILNACGCHKLQWSEGVLEHLQQQLKDGFKYRQQRIRCGCLQFLQLLCGRHGNN